MAMAALSTSPRLSAPMDRTPQWVFSREIPTDVVVLVGESKFPLHKFLLVAKSGYFRRKIVDSESPDVARIDLTELPGGEEAFEKAAMFCYGVNFEISVRNVAALRCAAEQLEMADSYCPNNLAARTEGFLAGVALKSLSGAVTVLRSCEALLPLAEEIGLVQRCVDAVALKACVESNFPSRSPAEWWAADLAGVGPSWFQMVLAGMKSHGASPKALATAVEIYAEKSLPGLVSADGGDRTSSEDDRGLLESIIGLLPDDLAVGFLCRLLRAAILHDCSDRCRRELEKRISSALEQVSVSDLMTITVDFRGERVNDVDSVRRIVAGFVERKMSGGRAAIHGGGPAGCSAEVQKVARTVDAFVGEIATDVELTVCKFAGIAGSLPKSARRFDDDLYRAVDVYLKAHPGLDEIEREKVCSVIDPLKLSYEARLHASQNKRLPLQIVLHALYYDQLKLRSGDAGELGASEARGRAVADAALMRENEELRSELTRMKMYMSNLQRSQGSGTKAPKRTFLSSVSRTLGKLNPFRHGSKDTSSIEDGGSVDVTKPRRRRFSLS